MPGRDLALAIVSDGVTDKMSPYGIASTIQRVFQKNRGGGNTATVPRSPRTLQCASFPEPVGNFRSWRAAKFSSWKIGNVGDFETSDIPERWKRSNVSSQNSQLERFESGQLRAIVRSDGRGGEGVRQRVHR